MRKLNYIDETIEINVTPALRIGSVGRSISSRYTVRTIGNFMAVEWLKKLHYAKRLPIMKTVFGIFDEELILTGVCVFSPAPSRFWNNGGKLFNDKHKIEVMELSRLCLTENHEKNLTSYFVSQCLKQLPKPNVIISYADKNQNHTGFIYQATNFIYTGEADPKNKIFDFILFGKKYHGRNMNYEFVKKILKDKYDEKTHWKDNILAVGGEIIKQEPKHRYIFINAKNRKRLIEDMIYIPQPYPKQENKNYEVNHKISVQRVLF